MDEKKFITFTDDLQTEIENISNIDLSNLDKNEILKLYINSEISLKDIIAEFKKRDIDLWKEYKKSLLIVNE
jgi:hypothetical protein